MDLAAPFCPTPDCPARGQSGQGNIGIHSRQERRFVGKQCHKTFTPTTGTAFYRVRPPAEPVRWVLTLRAPGCPLQASVGAFGFDERTVAAWFARAGHQAQAAIPACGKKPVKWGWARRSFCALLPCGDATAQESHLRSHYRAAGRHVWRRGCCPRG
jgi:transposase-like protein